MSKLRCANLKLTFISQQSDTKRCKCKELFTKTCLSFILPDLLESNVSINNYLDTKIRK